MELTTIEIPFTVPGGAGPLTWGQRAFWITLTGPLDEDLFSLCHILAVPSGRSAHDVAEAIRTLVQRHHVLVTRFPHYATEPYQEVASHGTVRLAVHAAAADDAERVAVEVRDEIGLGFRYEEEWPARFALVLADGAPRRLVIGISHLVIDGAGFQIVLDELGQLLDGPAPPPAEGTWSPLELAEFEQGIEGKEQSASAIRYWRTELLECPSTIFDFALLKPEPRRFWRLRMVSPAIADAAGRIARRHRCSTSAVILAALAAVLGHYTGHARIPMWLTAANRWRPPVSRTISQLSQTGTCSVTLDDRSFGELAKTTWMRALRCYQAAAYDPLDLARERRAVQRLKGAHLAGNAVRGHPAAGSAVFFNDTRRGDDWPQRPELADTVVEVDSQWNDVGNTLCFDLFDSDGHARVDLDFDTAFIPVRTARQLLTGIESLLVQAAGRDVRLDEVGAITGIAPVVRGEGWVRVEGAGWVALAEVTRLVAAVPDVVRCAVFVAGSGRLVAYLVASRTDATPALVHDQVCARLDGRTDVMAPQHYVLCAGPPADDSEAAWRSQPVIGSGSGRC